MALMPSNFGGKCKVCGKSIAKGERIEWTRKDGARHPQCVPRELAFAPAVDVAAVALAAELHFKPVEEAAVFQYSELRFDTSRSEL